MHRREALRRMIIVPVALAAGLESACSEPTKINPEFLAKRTEVRRLLAERYQPGSAVSFLNSEFEVDSHIRRHLLGVDEKGDLALGEKIERLEDDHPRRPIIIKAEGTQAVIAYQLGRKEIAWYATEVNLENPDRVRDTRKPLVKDFRNLVAHGVINPDTDLPQDYFEETRIYAEHNEVKVRLGYSG